MNAQELFKKGDIRAAAYYCEGCNKIWPTHHLAEKCCTPKLCTVCGKGDVRRRWNVICEECHSTADRKYEAERMAKAELVEYDGEPFFDEPSDKYFYSEESFIEHCREVERLGEIEVYCCRATVDFDIVDVEQLAKESISTDEGLLLPDYLKESIERFNRESCLLPLAWVPDYKRKIVITVTEDDE